MVMCGLPPTVACHAMRSNRILGATSPSRTASPENAVCSLAFAPNGDILVGSESHGVALASAATAYQKWNLVSGPGALPSDLVNDVLVARTGILYVATTGGLARSEDKGTTWACAAR